MAVMRNAALDGRTPYDRHFDRRRPARDNHDYLDRIQEVLERERYGSWDRLLDIYELLAEVGLGALADSSARRRAAGRV